MAKRLPACRVADRDKTALMLVASTRKPTTWDTETHQTQGAQDD